MRLVAMVTVVAGIAHIVAAQTGRLGSGMGNMPGTTMPGMNNMPGTTGTKMPGMNNISGMNMPGMNTVDDTTTPGMNMTGGHMHEMNMTGGHMHEMNMTGGHMQDMNMTGGSMPGMNMPGMNMPGINMPGMNMPGMNMPGMNMPGMDMASGKMQGMNMPGMSKWPCTMSDGMMTYFHDGYCEQILFDGLITSNTKGMIAACFVVMALLVLYEAIKLGREKLLSLARQKHAAGSADQPLSDTGRHPPATAGRVSVRSQMLQAPHALQSLLVLTQSVISYCVMMIFMTYNAWLCLAVVLGAGAGYFLFQWRRATPSYHGGANYIGNRYI